MKILIRVVIVLVVLIVLVVGSSYFWLDGAARKAVEVAGTDTLGVPLTLGSLRIGVLGGTASLAKLNIANPEGCDKPFFFDLQEGSTQVSLASVLADTIEIPSLELTGLTMYIEPQEGTGKYNYDVLLDNIAKNTGGESSGGPAEPEPEPQPAPEPEGEQKKVRIKRLLIRDVKVYYKTKVFVTTPVHVDEIEMQDVGSDGSGVDLGQLVAIVLTGALRGVADELPGAIGNGIKAGLGKVGEIGGVAVEVVGEGAKAVGGLAEGGANAVGEGAKAIGEGVGGLFGGGNKDKKDDENK